MPYVWQRLNKANHNHFIVEVFDIVNRSDRPVWSEYFDGTQAQALEHFSRQPKIRRYMRQVERYNVSMRANAIQLNWIDD